MSGVPCEAFARMGLASAINQEECSMRPTKRVVVTCLLGIGCFVPAFFSAASAMALADPAPTSAGAFLSIAMEEGDLWTNDPIAVDVQSLSSCLGASAIWRSTRQLPLAAPASGVVVLQSDTTTIPPPPPPPPPGIERDLCSDALRTRQYWCDRAAGPDGTHNDLINCQVWDLLASFLCSIAAATDGADDPLAIRWRVGLDRVT